MGKREELECRADSSVVREKVRQSIAKIGASETSRRMGMPRETVLGLGAGADVREATLFMAADRVMRLEPDALHGRPMR